MRLFVLAFVATFGWTVQTRAATFDVFFNGEIEGILSGSTDFLSVAPFGVGETLSAKFTFDNAPLQGGSTPGISRYLNTAITISGSLGTYGFQQATRPDPLRPIQVNDTQVRGADPTAAGDLIQSRHSVAAEQFNGWTLQTLTYAVFDPSGSALTDDSFGPDLFSGLLINGLNDPSQTATATFVFTKQGNVSVSVLVDLKKAPTPVPLPPAMALMAVAIALLLIFGRKDLA
ncbi:MAG: hypothetical protein AAF667_20465 [Pseudomonadota bacterium]